MKAEKKTRRSRVPLWPRNLEKKKNTTAYMEKPGQDKGAHHDKMLWKARHDALAMIDNLKLFNERNKQVSFYLKPEVLRFSLELNQKCMDAAEKYYGSYPNPSTIAQDEELLRDLEDAGFYDTRKELRDPTQRQALYRLRDQLSARKTMERDELSRLRKESAQHGQDPNAHNLDHQMVQALQDAGSDFGVREPGGHIFVRKTSSK